MFLSSIAVTSLYVTLNGWHSRAYGEFIRRNGNDDDFLEQAYTALLQQVGYVAKMCEKKHSSDKWM